MYAEYKGAVFLYNSTQSDSDSDNPKLPLIINLVPKQKLKKLDLYGQSVSIYDKDLVVGAGGGLGNIYFFEKQINASWIQIQQRQALDAEVEFGSSVFMHGKYCIAGAPPKYRYSDATGVVFIYHKTEDSWQTTHNGSLQGSKVRSGGEYCYIFIIFLEKVTIEPFYAVLKSSLTL